MSKCFQKSSKYLLPRWLDPQSRPSLRRCLGVQTPIWKTYSRTPWEKSECLQVDLQFFAGHFKTPSQNIQISPTTKGLGHSTWHAGNRCHSCGLQVWKHKPVKCWQCYRVIIWVIIEVCKCYSLWFQPIRKRWGTLDHFPKNSRNNNVWNHHHLVVLGCVEEISSAFTKFTYPLEAWLVQVPRGL